MFLASWPKEVNLVISILLLFTIARDVPMKKMPWLVRTAVWRRRDLASKRPDG
jgi:hypothetical protein